MKASIITIVLFYIFVFIIGVAFQDIIFPWGGTAESHLKPIYLGLIVLSGLIVGCTVYLADAIKKIKAELFTKKNKEKLFSLFLGGVS